MKSMIFKILRILFAIFLLFFGTNKLLHFVDPPPPPSADAIAYWTALMTAQTMTVVAIVETLAGIALLFNKYASLMMVILMSVSINAVLYHLALDPDSVIMAVALLVLNVVMLYHYRANYKDLLS